MGALPRPKLTEPTKKPPVVETRRDQYGRDPESKPEQWRRQTNYDSDSGYAPMYHAVLSDLPRLASGAVCYAFVLVVNALSYGRGIDPRTKRRYDTTLPISASDLAEHCRANVRDIQRQLTELKERGMISVKTLRKSGTVCYELSLLYRDWQKIEDYAIWKRRQVVSIDDLGEPDEPEDDEPLPISKDAVRLTKRPEVVRPGRASRAKQITVGVKWFKFQSNDNRVDLTHDAVIQSGCLVVSVSSAAVSAGETKGEQKANVERHTCRADTPKVGEFKGKHPIRGAQFVVSLFDPLLQKSGSRLLSPDKTALQAACTELAAMPHDYLVHYVMTQRASRPISGPKVVASIVRDARVHWEKQEQLVQANIPRCRKCHKDISESGSVQGLCWSCYG